LVEPSEGDLLRVELFLEFYCRRAAGLRNFPVDRVDRAGELVLARVEFRPLGLEAIDLGPRGLDLTPARSKLLFGQSVAGPREASLRAPPVILELLVLDRLEALAAEGPEMALDLSQEGL